MTKPLYITGKTPDGRKLLGGVFRMQDELGFPIDCSLEEAKRHNMLIDWLEAFCDCWLNSPSKFDSFVRQAELCTNANLYFIFGMTVDRFLRKHPKASTRLDSIAIFCRY